MDIRIVPCGGTIKFY